MSRKARLGFIGLNTMGQGLVRAAIQTTRGEIAALCDVDRGVLDEAQAKYAPEAVICTEDRDLFALQDLDGVVVAVPQYLHGELTVKSLEAGFSTFCEKPMALTVKECNKMVNAARMNNRKLMVGHVLRYLGPHCYALELAKSGELGEPLAMTSVRTLGRWGSWARPWRLQRKTSGGLLAELNIHEIDLMLQVLGKATKVSGIGRDFPDSEVDYENFISAHITFMNGGVGTLTSVSGDYVGRHSATIYLERGTIHYDSLTSQVIVGKEDGEKDILDYKEIHPESEDGVVREMREFIEACLGESEVTIPGEDGLRAVEIAQATYQSVTEGRPIPLPLAI